MIDEERVIARADVPEEAVIPIYAGAPAEPIRPTTLEVSKSMANQIREVYSLVFYSSDGDELERLQFDTLEIALDQAKALTGIGQAEWSRV